MAVDSPQRAQTGVLRVLEADPDLAGDLGGTALAEATQHALAVAQDVPTGPWAPPAERPEGVVCLLVVSGVLLQEMPAGRHRHARLGGPGDLIDPWVDDGVFAAERTWTALIPSRVAALGSAFLSAATRWPALTEGLMRRAAANSESLAALAAVAHLPRVEDRLVAVLWYLAQRFGRVRPDGILVAVPLTHAQLGQLVGSRRPTVTLAVGTLAEAGLVSRCSEGWLVSPECGEMLSDNRIPVVGVVASPDGSDGAVPQYR